MNRTTFENSSTTVSGTATGSTPSNNNSDTSIVTKSTDIFDLHRRYFNQAEFDAAFPSKDPKSDNPVRSAFHYLFKYYKPSGACATHFLFDRLPFIGWLREYKLKEYLVKDLIAGLTIGVIHIPQGKFLNS